MTALAPGRFSVNKVTPSVRLICSPRMRARMSAVPPAGYGTTILTVLAVCDDAPVSPRTIERAPAAARQRDRRLGRFMMMPPQCVVSTAYQRPADGPRALPLNGTERTYLHDLLHVRFRGEADMPRPLAAYRPSRLPDSASAVNGFGLSLEPVMQAKNGHGTRSSPCETTNKPTLRGYLPGYGVEAQVKKARPVQLCAKMLSCNGMGLQKCHGDRILYSHGG